MHQTKRINSPDTEADIKLKECLDRTPRTSFVMIAGAGSGKTTSLVKSLSHLISTQGYDLRRRGQKVACITYTEIAAKEIRNDVENNNLVHVSTIHSFFWSIIGAFQRDIKNWLLQRIDEKCEELQQKIDNPRTRVKEKYVAEQAKLILQRSRVENIEYFKYGAGSNYGKGILGHDDIIKLVTSSIETHRLLVTIIGQKYPYIFVDESQDTFPKIISSLKIVESANRGKFCLGFFGDPMQKIFPTGIGEIAAEPEWVSITKSENFRCSIQVLKTINKIRKPVDGLEQVRGRYEVRDGKEIPVEGNSLIFILPIDENRTNNVRKVKEWCAASLLDGSWLDDKIKTFVLVHRMAAIRLGFANLYSAMNDNSPSAFKEGLLDGTAWPLKPFMSFVLPLVEFNESNQNFNLLSILRSQSPKLTKGNMKGVEVRNALSELKAATDKLLEMMMLGSTATVIDVLKHIQENGMAIIDDRLDEYISGQSQIESVEDEDGSLGTIELDAIQRYFMCPATEFLGYSKYCVDESPFATQQGIKGVQFEKVITIADDDEGTHTHFSYDKYFGLASLSGNDEKNINEGRDNVIARTGRLFYVSCSRAMKDLVVIYFTHNPNTAKAKIRELGIFQAESIFDNESLK